MKKIFILLSIISCLFCPEIKAQVANAGDKLLSEQQEKESSELVYNIQKIVDKLKEGKIGKASDVFVSLTTLLIVLGAVISITYSTIVAAQKGEVISLEVILKPIIIAAVLCSYQPLTKGVDWCINVFDGLIVELGDDSLETIKEKRDEKWNILKEIAQKKVEMMDNNVEEDGGFWQPVLDALSAVLESLNQFKTWVVHQSIMLLSFCAVFLTRLLGATLGIIFYIIGPICIAMSAIPIFKDNWKNWLSKYIWVSLFAPICRLISWVLQEVEVAVLESDISRLTHILNNMEATGGNLGSIGEGFMEGTAYLGFMVVGAILYIAVPSIASWIVNTSGGGIMTAMNAAGSYLGTKAMKGGKTGLAGGYNAGKTLYNKIKDKLSK